MKRLSYISKMTRSLSAEQIEEIEAISVKNNGRDHITGVLLCLRGIFFQILEGETSKVEALYDKILQDKRHTDVLCLKAEYNVRQRLFPDWAMRTINLDDSIPADILIQPIKTLLQTVTESHRMLERYTQPSVINIINRGINPLTVMPHTVEKIIFFSDIFSFSTFSEKLPVEKVVNLVNHYFSICAHAITRHGGEIVKFIGDCVMASFDEHQADSAIAAGLEILSELHQLRTKVYSDNPLHFLYTGIGLSYGSVIEGNMGSSVKMDYTLLGDVVNIASRLEGLTRHLPYVLLLSAELKNHCLNNWSFVNLGEHQTKGKEKLVTVYGVDVDVAKKSADAEQMSQFISQALDRLGTQ